MMGILEEILEAQGLSSNFAIILNDLLSRECSNDNEDKHLDIPDRLNEFRAYLGLLVRASPCTPE